MGDVFNYVEPFAGSLAVLLARPDWHSNTTATVNDKDRYLANFWRAVTYAPDEVAHYADWPVNECDLEARHLWLVNEGLARMADNLYSNPDWYDAKIAGWWLWGICAWIGGSWCSGNGPHTYTDGTGRGIKHQRPQLGNPGQGINRKRPHLSNPGRGINRKLPHLSNPGRGINRKLQDIHAYMLALRDKLRNVRVCCGDWRRIVTPGALSYGSSVGVFLDPPYSDPNRDGVYNEDSYDVAHDVREWCIANGDNPRYRIVLCGYYAEHAAHMPDGWRVERWRANAAYQTAASNGANQYNRTQECIWCSPHCLTQQPALFDFAPSDATSEGV